LTALAVSILLYVLLNCFDPGVDILFVALATRRNGMQYLSAVNFLPRNPSQEEFGMAKTVADQFENSCRGRRQNGFMALSATAPTG
jgi:hypothetical protein